jgi:hypothetical protein
MLVMRAARCFLLMDAPPEISESGDYALVGA